jgi:3-oxoadipate enol-lactonase
MPLIQYPHVHLYYDLTEQTGPPLVLVNGFSSDLGMWDRLIPFLSPQFQLLRFDHAGVGRSTLPSYPYSIDDMADDLIALLDTLNLPKVDMMGFSMGNLVIQSIALHYQERLGKAVMLAPFNRLPLTAYLQAQNYAKLWEAGVDKRLLIERKLPWFYSQNFLADPRRIEALFTEEENHPYPQSLQGYHFQLKALHAYDKTDQLANIRHPIFLCAGEDDLYTPLYAVKALERQLPQNTLVMLPEVGHMIHMECTQEQFTPMVSWLLQN